MNSSSKERTRLEAKGSSDPERGGPRSLNCLNPSLPPPFHSGRSLSFLIYIHTTHPHIHISVFYIFSSIYILIYARYAASSRLGLLTVVRLLERRTIQSVETKRLRERSSFAHETLPTISHILPSAGDVRDFFPHFNSSFFSHLRQFSLRLGII